MYGVSTGILTKSKTKQNHLDSAAQSYAVKLTTSVHTAQRFHPIFHVTLPPHLSFSCISLCVACRIYIL